MSLKHLSFFFSHRIIADSHLLLDQYLIFDVPLHALMSRLTTSWMFLSLIYYWSNRRITWGIICNLASIQSDILYFYFTSARGTSEVVCRRQVCIPDHGPGHVLCLFFGP